MCILILLAAYYYFFPQLTFHLNLYMVPIIFREKDLVPFSASHLSLANKLVIYPAKQQKTRKILSEKIAQLNSAIDDVSAQLRAEDGPNGAAVASDEVEAAL